VQRISSLTPIPGSDKIEQARVLGWNVVVTKGDFHVDDKVVYVETDSVLPDRPEFSFMKSQKGIMKPVVAKKIRGIVSQGLIFPLSILSGGKDYTEGEDITALLGVVKYDPPEVVYYGVSPTIGSIPSCIERSDEVRIQAYQFIENIKGKSFVVTEKINGTSFTCFIIDGRVGICNHDNEVSKKLPSVYQQIYERYNLENRMKTVRDSVGFDFAIQGEIYGRKIQGNNYNMKGIDLAVFNIINLNTGEQYLPNHTITVMLGLETVPFIEFQYLIPADIDNNKLIDNLVEIAKGKSVLNPQHEREGLVFRMNEFDRNCCGVPLQRVSFKVINPNFLCRDNSVVNSSNKRNKRNKEDLWVVKILKRLSRRLKKLLQSA
jgi:RNA ligase (TIGR02306 family)